MADRPAEVLCVGISVHDIVMHVERAPTAPGKYRAMRRVEVGGGVAANAAATVARLGGRARYVGPLGDDWISDRIIEDLCALNIDVTGVNRISGQESPLSVVLVDGFGERTIINHAGPSLFSGAGASIGLGAAAAVLVDMRWPAGAIPVLAAAKTAGVPAVVDCDHDPMEAPGILETASHVVFSLPTLERWTSRAGAEKALEVARERLPGWLAVTDGERGVSWIDQGVVHHGPAFHVEVVDTLGAGDVFHGAFALALAEGRRESDALRWSAAAAALKCTRFGGRRGIPDRDEVDRMVEASAPWS